MRIELRGAERTVAMLAEQELIQFKDEAEVRLVLRLFSGEAQNMASLRQFLAEEIGAHGTLALTDDQVIDRLAPVVARSCVGLVRTELLPVRSSDAVTGDFETGELEMEFDPLLDQEVELEDPIPKSVLPPTFIRVADMEASGLLQEEGQYSVKLDMLRYVGLEGEGESEIAEVFKENAGRSKEVLQVGSTGLAADLSPLAVAAGLLSKFTQTGRTLLKSAGESGESLFDKVRKAAETLIALLQNPGDDPAPGETGPAMRDIASSQGNTILEGAKGNNQALSELLQGEGLDPAPLGSGPAFRKIGEEQGEALTKGADTQGEALKELNEGEGPPPPEDTEVAKAFEESGGMQSAVIVGSAIATAATLTLLGGRSQAEKKVLDAPRWSLDPEPPKGARLIGLPEAGVWMTAKSDGSKTILFDVYRNADEGSDVQLASFTAEVEDGVARAFWEPEDPAAHGEQPIYFEGRTEDRLVRLQSPGAPFGDPVMVDEALLDKTVLSVEAVGWLTRPGDPRMSAQDELPMGPVYLIAATTLPGLIEMEVHDAFAEPDEEGNPPKPLITFNIMAEEGFASVPWSTTKLPGHIRGLRVIARPKRGAGAAAECEAIIVPPFMFTDSNLEVDDSVPPDVQPKPEVGFEALYFALTPDGDAVDEVPPEGAWIIAEVLEAETVKLKLFSRAGEAGREGLGAFDAKVEDGRAAFEWVPDKPVDRSLVGVGFQAEADNAAGTSDEVPWVPHFMFGA